MKPASRKFPKGKRRIPSRKLRRRGEDPLAEARKVARVVQAMMPQTAQVLGVAAQAGMRALGQAAIDELSRVDGQLAAQLVALLAKKRTP